MHRLYTQENKYSAAVFYSTDIRNKTYYTLQEIKRNTVRQEKILEK